MLSTKREIEKRRKYVQNLHGHLELWSFYPYFGHYELFTKILIIMSIFIKIHKYYVCDPLGPYILLVTDFIDLITPY